MKKLSLRTLIQNLYSLWVYDYHRKDNLLESEINYLAKSIRWLKIQNEFLKKSSPSDSDEIQFIKQLASPTNFPYQQIKRLSLVECGFDDKLKLPYVLHNKHKLYYPKSYSLEMCEHCYRGLIEKDQIIGGGFLTKAPHCYQTEQFKIEDGDVLFDCGSAEGLFALEMIDIVSHVYLIEADADWLPAIRATFAPFKDKVTIVSKFLSDKNNNRNVTLATLLSKHSSPCFVKMDIEGAEPMVIEASKEYLKSRNNVRLVCCTYHYQNDAEKLSRIFESIGYQYEYSDGWMICLDFEDVEPPFLRHGLIRAYSK